MTADPRAALNNLVSALERHLEAAAAKRGDDDSAVVAAYQDVEDAFQVYDDALYEAYEEMTPLVIPDDDEDDDFEHDDDFEDDHDELDDDDEEDDGEYSGLAEDDVDYDED